MSNLIYVVALTFEIVGVPLLFRQNEQPWRDGVLAICSFLFPPIAVYRVCCLALQHKVEVEIQRQMVAVGLAGIWFMIADTLIMAAFVRKELFWDLPPDATALLVYVFVWLLPVAWFVSFAWKTQLKRNRRTTRR